MQMLSPGELRRAAAASDVTNERAPPVSWGAANRSLIYRDARPRLRGRESVPPPTFSTSLTGIHQAERCLPPPRDVDTPRGEVVAGSSLTFRFLKHQRGSVAPPLHRHQRAPAAAPPVLEVEREQLVVDVRGQPQHLQGPLLLTVSRHPGSGTSTGGGWAQRAEPTSFHFFLNLCQHD